ncbi:G patch domain-containing protein 11 [Punica granatum]|uniref:G patch domain-containing protein 11 n=1 Tax=Punica granatum TaxID=22663 RepID=A0A6P8BWT5_PUNGR|nr:G patch domain-containing protein 11 [Punica granatum]XP_031374788.1 G patch domain-containing protein 11 [Punica granatum]XP_031374789.1 G patch domain-containing protein 11 [Punica granatum]XP_031374790.1 G patch domain-containing protein 11 [Punica granatum]
MDNASNGSSGTNEVLGREPSSSRSSAPAIDSSNKGFQLLKKHGWKEGTGLGIYEQGRLEPVETHMKNNKHGLGADKVKKKIPKTSNAAASDGKDGNEKLQSKKSKALSKKARKMLELEKQLQDKEFERAFFREFWPENV